MAAQGTYFFEKVSATSTQPTIKLMPPKGVMAPTHFKSKRVKLPSVMAYSDPQKNTSPKIKANPACFSRRDDFCRYNSPTRISAIP